MFAQSRRVSGRCQRRPVDPPRPVQIPHTPRSLPQITHSKCAVCNHLIECKHLFLRQHRRHGQFRRARLSDKLFCAPLCHQSACLSLPIGKVAHQRFACCKAGIVAQILATQHPEQAVIFLQLQKQDRHPAIGNFELCVVEPLLTHRAVEESVQRHRIFHQKFDCRVQHRHRDMRAALPCPARDKRGQNTLCCGAPGNFVRDRALHIFRLAMPPLHPHKAAQGLDHQVIGAHIRPRPFGAKARDRGIDQIGVIRFQCRIAQSQPLHHAGPKIFHNHITLCRQRAECRFSLVGPQVDYHRFFAAIYLHKDRGQCLDAGFADVAHYIAAGRFDFDDLGAHMRQNTGAGRARQHRRHVENFDGIEKCRHNGIPLYNTQTVHHSRPRIRRIHVAT